MTTKTLIAALTLAASTMAGLSLPASDAAAHASLETGQATAGSMYKAVMRIPHGCEGQPTIALTIDLPEGVIAAKPMPKPGWKVETVWGAYGKTYDYYGTPMSEGVRQIRWSGGSLPDDFFDEFVFRARLSADLADTTVAFATTQFCPDGADVAWTELAAPGQDPHDLTRPAPILTVAAKQDMTGHGHAGMQVAQAGGIVVEAPFARASAGPVKNGATYLTLKNEGGEPDRLIAVRAPVADRLELHTHLHENGVMKMRHIDAIVIPAGGMTMLKPGGDHIMMMGLKAPLKEGNSFPLTLVFEKAGEITVDVGIGGVGAMQGRGDNSHHGTHGQKKH